MSAISSRGGNTSALIAYTTSGTTHQSAYATSSKEYDFLDFLGVAQSLKLDFLPFTWQPELDTVGKGGTAEIYQELVSVRLTLAFKRLRRPRSVFEEIRNLQALVAEISVLGHPAIQRHPNIAGITGIAWDVVSGGEKVWPVLVFDKTECGDLFRFMTEGAGKELDFRDRLDLLYDVGLAVRTLHLHGVIHGDIKPNNVLVYTEVDGHYRAKAIDFGYSSLFMPDSGTIIMPFSEFWTAPEQHHREILPVQARRMDAYSFGMLCLWLFFYNKSEDGDRNFRRDREDPQKDPLGQAYEFLEAETALDDRRKKKIQNIFRLTLAEDPTERTVEFTELLELLSSNRALSLANLKEEIPIPQGDFQFTLSSHQLIKAHYGVRCHITQCLRNKNEQRTISQLQALDLALCYEIGFGVKKDETKCKSVLKENKISSKTLKDLIKRLKGSPDHSTFPKSTLQKLSKDGYLPVFDFGRQYHQEQRLHEAESQYENELRTLGSSLGQSHPLVQQLRLQLCFLMRSEGRRADAEKMQLQILKFDQRIALESPLTGFFATFLADVYGHQGQLKEIERLQIYLLERDKKRSGVAHPLTLVSMANLAETYSKQGEWKKAEELQLQIVERESKAPSSKELPGTLNNMSALATTYRSQQRWKEAEELGKQVMAMRSKVLGMDHPTMLADINNLAKIYIDQKWWQEAEELVRQGVETSRKVLGVQNVNTINLMANLAMVCERQGRWEESKDLRLQVTGTRKKVLGSEHPDTLTSMASLAYAYSMLRQNEEAERLRVQVMDSRTKALGAEHPDTLGIMAKLATTYTFQERWEDAERLEERVMEARKRVLGADHPDTLTSMASLVSAYEVREAWGKAEELALRLVGIQERVLGARHRDTLDSVGKLVYICKRQERWGQPEAWELRQNADREVA